MATLSSHDTADSQKSPVFLIYYPYNEKTCVLELEADSFADARAGCAPWRKGR